MNCFLIYCIIMFNTYCIGNAPERGATTPSALGSPRGGDITSSSGGMLPPPSSPVSRGDQLHKRIESLVQQVIIIKNILLLYII